MANVSSSNGLEKRPKLRFPGFDEPWRPIAFGNLVHEYSDRTKEEDEDTLLSAAIEGMFLNTELFGHQRGASNKGYKKIKYGTMVLSTQNLHLGNANVNLRFDHGMVSPAYKTYVITGCSVDLIAQWIKSDAAKRFFYNATTVGASVCRRNVEWDTLYEQSLYLPCRDEQEKVAKFLGLLSNRINKQQRFVSALKKYKRGVTAKLIAAIEEKYPVVRLGDHVTVMRGGSPRPIDAYITNAENGIRWIKIGDALPDQLYISDTKEKIKPEGAKKSRRVYAGDLILSNSMSFGRPYILKVDGCIHDGWLLIRDEEKKFDKRFLCFYLASDVTLAQYKKYAAGSCVNNLNSELVASVEIGMPPIEQQIRMANILEKIDRQVEAASTMYLLLSKLRSSLLQQLFI